VENKDIKVLLPVTLDVLREVFCDGAMARKSGGAHGCSQRRKERKMGTARG
jgi:hypothetical protein